MSISVIIFDIIIVIITTFVLFFFNFSIIFIVVVVVTGVTVVDFFRLIAPIFSRCTPTSIVFLVFATFSLDQ